MTDWDDEFDESDDASDTMPCPACGAEIYHDAQRCPVCGQYVVMRTGATPRRVWWWVALGLALAAILLFVLARGL